MASITARCKTYTAFKKQKKGRGEANHNRLLTIENKLSVAGGRWAGGWARWVMGIKEGTCDEHLVLYVSDESLHSTPETNFTTDVN